MQNKRLLNLQLMAFPTVKGPSSWAENLPCPLSPPLDSPEATKPPPPTYLALQPPSWGFWGGDPPY